MSQALKLRSGVNLFAILLFSLMLIANLYAAEVRGSSTKDMKEFAKLGDFIQGENINIINLELCEDGVVGENDCSGEFHNKWKGGNKHGSYTFKAFKRIAAKEHIDNYSKVVINWRSFVEDTKSEEIKKLVAEKPVIGLVPFGVKDGDEDISTGWWFNLDYVYDHNPKNVIVLMASGNTKGISAESYVDHYQDNFGKQLFLGGSYWKGPQFLRSEWKDEWRTAGKWDNDAYITGNYAWEFRRDYFWPGTSYSIQEVGAKLAILYEALNYYRGDWNLEDAMQLLMSTRDDRFAPDLRKLIVKKNGKRELLSEAELRSRIN